MEKKIEKIKQEIKTQNHVYQAIAGLCLIALCVNSSGMLTSAYTDPHAANFVQGFITGIVIFTEFYVFLQFRKNVRVSKDEAQLKRLYNEQHDERTQQIHALAGQKSMQIVSILSIAAGLVVCYFSLEAFLGMLGIVILMGIVKKCCTVYYNRMYTGE